MLAVIIVNNFYQPCILKPEQTVACDSDMALQGRQPVLRVPPLKQGHLGSGWG